MTKQILGLAIGIIIGLVVGFSVKPAVVCPEIPPFPEIPNPQPAVAIAPSNVNFSEVKKVRFGGDFVFKVDVNTEKVYLIDCDGHVFDSLQQLSFTPFNNQ